MIDGLFSLPKDILLEPIESLPDSVLTGFEHKSGDFALTRPQSRSNTHIVNDSTAKLLEIFREPVTIADAIVRFSQTEHADPTATLDEAFPVLRTLIEAGMLLPSDSHLASPIDFLIERGERVGDLVVEQPIAVVLDTEVYRARAHDGGWAALKIARPGSEGRLKAALQHEAEVLAVLDGACSPRLVAQGDHAGRPFIAMEWCRGVDALAAADLIRGRDPIDKRELKAIALAIVEAYAQLHQKRVVHGDVHPRNLLVGSSGRVTIIDFGQAHSTSDQPASSRPGRGVVDLYMEPELARARLDRGRLQPPTPAGEQYSIAALLYFLLAGAHTHDFVLEEGKMLRQVIGEPPMTFAERGLSGFDHVERALRRALEKSPDARFASVRDFQQALQQAFDRDWDAHAGRLQRGAHRRTARRLLLDELIERSIIGGQLMNDGVEPPSASVNFGSAGLAVAMLRIAQQRESESLLAVADIWSHAALRDIQSSRATAFTAPDLEMNSEVVGEASLYHASPGVLCVAALVADAQADEERREQMVAQFAAAAAAEEPRAELVFGVAGSLLGCGVLLDALASTGEEEKVLKRLGDDLNKRLLERLDPMPIIGDATDSGRFGVAHGYAGILYSLLQWAQVSSAPVPRNVQMRLEQLATLAQPVGRGLAWPVSGRRRTLDTMRATWCNGAAGHLHLWLLGYELLRDPRYLDLAEGAAWTSYEAPGTGGDLCCGSAGRAYALLRFFRHSGEQIWLDRASELAEHAANVIRVRQLRKNSLYRGEVGVGLLAADLDDPSQARMPLFELS